MQTRHVPPADWQEFAAAFTRAHQGWLMSVYRERPDRSRHYIAHDRPLHALSIHGNEVALTLGGDTEKQCEVPIARDIVIEQTDDGADIALTLAEPAGYGTVIEFRAAMPVIAVDGIAPILPNKRCGRELDLR